MSGKLIIFSAPSGAGKTTIVHHLLKVNKLLEFSVSACSRHRRGNEKNGADYYFLSVEEFKKRIENDEFIEWEEVYENNFYGTLRSEVERIWKMGKHVIFDVDVDGGLNLKKQFGTQALAIFVMPPSIESLEKRLKGRQTDTPESIAKRTAKAVLELKKANLFDKLLLNEHLHTAFAEAEKMVNEFLEK